MKKYIFLDIDGVIAIPKFGEHWGLDDLKQDLLGEILEKSNAEIVLSSSWRKDSLDSTKEYMSERGFK